MTINTNKMVVELEKLTEERFDILNLTLEPAGQGSVRLPQKRWFDFILLGIIPSPQKRYERAVAKLAENFRANAVYEEFIACITGPDQQIDLTFYKL